MTWEERQQLAASVEKCSLIGCMVLYKDDTTNTYSSLLNRPKVKGLLLHFDEKSYLLPVPQRCDTSTIKWIRNVLKGVLKKEDTVKVAVNCKQFVIALLHDFDLGENKGPVDWQFEDPLVAGWLLSPDNPPHTLRDLCKSLQLPYTQDEGPHGDLKMSVVVMKKLHSELMRENLWPLFYHVEMALTPLLAVMEQQAIRVNVQNFLTFSQILKKKIDKVEKKAFQLAGHSFCINSTQQLRQLLYEELRLDQQLRKVALTASAHHKSTSEAMLKQLVAIHPLPGVILEYRHMLKLKSTYVDGMLEAVEEGVLYTHWDQMSAATGRLVSSHPNLQAIPKTPTTITDYEDSFIVGAESKNYEIYAREPFIANEGHVFLAADFQQIELRLLAHLANDPALKNMFRSKEKSADIFIQLTAQWLSKAYEDVTHAEREQTKRVVYSILYGVGKERLAEYLKVSSTRAKDIMDSFLVSFPAIQVFTKKCVDYAQKHGYTETVMGRKRWLGRVHHQAAHLRAQAERQAVNFCVQGSAADLCKRAMVKVEQALHSKKHLSARLLMHIHDELVWELPEGQLLGMCELVKQVMENDALLCQPMLPCLTVPITVSLSSGTSWAHLSPCP
ncbi:DNA polymerase nu-like [Babylonia areolata]|uniref:DNA polymerase nu-like n=1 Tax=Babylonia areolata TaxID=304850 RepID=UPI003FD06311